jgi:tRNA(adenine34) deaminase
MISTDIHEGVMRAAIAEARVALGEGEMPYGAVVATAGGDIVSRAHDRVTVSQDPTRHGEFDAVRLAIEVRGGDLKDCMLVSTVEPCCMCSGAAWYAGIGVAAFGLTMRELKGHCPAALEEVFGPVGETYADMDRQMRAVEGVLREDCLALWQPYMSP